MKEEPDYSNGHLEGRSRNEIDLYDLIFILEF